MPGGLIDNLLKKLVVQHPGRSSEITQTGRALGTAEIAARRGFDAEGRGFTPYDGFSQDSAQVKRAPKQEVVGDFK